MNTETRALLLTDVVDSTKMAARIGDAAMAALWAAHDRVARDLLPLHGGREIDKTDGMLLMFDGAAPAVAYAIAYQRALATLPTPLLARAGLHVGPVILRENSAEDVARGAKPIEVDGLAKPTAARVMSMARGGQVLLTPEARTELDEAVQGGGALSTWRTTSHGHWSLKGLTDPIEVFEVGDDEAKFQPPEEGDKAHRMVRSGERWVPVSALPNNLPPQRSSFVGREREIKDIQALLDDSPLVTVLGMGGLGKTRLTLQVAAERLPKYPDGAWFVDLSGVHDPAHVVGAVARTFEIFDEPGRPLTQTVCAWLKTRRLLIVLDNCEHVVAAAAELADAILGQAGGVQLLASSRELLDVPGEQQYPIHPLPLPERDAGMEALQQSAAVRMFAERAKAQRPSFDLATQEPAQLAELVTRLEGIPLAIELAAAKLRTLSVPEILAGLDDRYQMLSGGSRVLQKRQQTLRALVDWSYDMLEEDERRVLARLGVFAGGFDRDAAVAVCADDKVPARRLPDLLASLVQKSLAWREGDTAAARYRMLETIREYAREKLAEQGDAAPTAERHCAHYFALAKEAARGIQSAEQGKWVRRLEDEIENLRAAMKCVLGGGTDPLIAVKMPLALRVFWELRGYTSEGRKLVQAALAMPAIQQSDMALAHALYTDAALASAQGDHVAASRTLETCLELRRRIGDPMWVAGTLSTLSLVRLQAGDVNGAASRENEALQLFTEIQNEYGQALSWLHRGQIHARAGNPQGALADLPQALALARAIGNPEIEAECELTLGEVLLMNGEPERARDAVQRSLGVCEGAADKRGEATARWWLGRLALRGGDAEAARALLPKALRQLQLLDMRAQMLGCLDDMALLLALEGSPGAALELAVATDQARGRLLLNRSPLDEQRWRDEMRRIWQALPESVAESACEAGRGLETEDALRAALDEAVERRR
ncbi:MAG: tetratricopeptide repeat protein [Rubrivivax sp.]|nr:tetratricopeptide repeat protein [Rubrivivax sp.]